jgi:uncharacterized RDD family membrane protein YckC
MTSATNAQVENADPERPLAAAIDVALLAALACLLTLPARILGYEHRLSPDIALISAAVACYYVGFEVLLKATPGKLFVGLRVTTLDGGLPHVWQIIVRNLLRVVDVLPALYFVGAAAAVAATKHRQRFGDLAAGTIVRRIPAGERTRSIREYAVLAAAIAFTGGAVAITALGIGEVVWMNPSVEFALGLATIARAGGRPTWALQPRRTLRHTYVCATCWRFLCMDCRVERPLRSCCGSHGRDNIDDRTRGTRARRGGRRAFLLGFEADRSWKYGD